MSASQQLTAHAESRVGRARANAHLRRLRLVVELRLCSTHAPAGVFVMPSLRSSSTSEWTGALFVRRGPFRGAAIRFTVQFGSRFPRTPPAIALLAPLPFHPCVDAVRGLVSFAHEPQLVAWAPETCFVVDLLVALHRMFEAVPDVPHALAANHEACALLAHDRAAFLARARDSVLALNAALDADLVEPPAAESIAGDDDDVAAADDPVDAMPFTRFDARHAELWQLMQTPPHQRVKRSPAAQQQPQQQQQQPESLASIRNFFTLLGAKLTDPKTGPDPPS